MFNMITENSRIPERTKRR